MYAGVISKSLVMMEGYPVKTLKLETLELVYNEQNNEIRLLVNSFGSAATLFVLDATNLMAFMEEIAQPKTRQTVLVAQPITEQVITVMEDGNDCGELQDGFAYHLSDDDLSEHFNGSSYSATLLLDSEDRVMVETEMWNLGNILDYVMG